MKRHVLPRRKNGQFDHQDFSLMCKCGHTLAVHSAINDTPYRPCFDDDLGSHSDCECPNFVKAKKQPVKGRLGGERENK